MADHPLEHPPYDIAPLVDTLGTRHVREMLNDLDWPLTTTRLRARAGAWRVPITGAHMHAFSEMLDGVREQTFGGPRDVVRAIERAHPELRGA